MTQVTEQTNHGSFGQIIDFFAGGGAVVLSGAGLSTESGIPDYRGPTGLARRPALANEGPMTYQTFTGSEAARRRYWARSHVGWRHIGLARPNAGHLAVAALERAGLVTGVITQNVDGLHQAAGSAAVTELHGSLHRVACLACGERTSRVSLDERLRAANRGWDTAVATVNPDGDAVLADDDVLSFVIVDCGTCGGVLKPDVVFFGENVPPVRARACYGLVEQAQALVVLGSSLTVMSGLRYVRHAAKLGLPIMIINQGPTRGDEFATVKLEAPLGETLSAVAAAAALRRAVPLVGRRILPARSTISDRSSAILPVVEHLLFGDDGPRAPARPAYVTGYDIERTLAVEGLGCVAGVDEVGRGAWAGPVTVCAVICSSEFPVPPGLTDSKLLSPRRRAEIAAELLGWVDAYAIGEADHAEIDAAGMTVALRRAAVRALSALPRRPDAVLLDGAHDYIGRPWPVRCEVKADLRSVSVAAASVIAKVHRDRFMAELSCPGAEQFAFGENAGYPSPVHKDALAALGPTPYHRLSWSYLDDLPQWRHLKKQRPDIEGQLTLI